MEKPFPFPWNKQTFFNVFPESFLQVPAQIKPVPDAILNIKFDLLLLHYQVWFLSPSIPVTSFLKSSYAAKMLYNTPVVTISGSRNMWFMAQDKIKALLKNNNAQLVGNIALTNRAAHLISVLTIVNWMFSGVKKGSGAYCRSRVYLIKILPVRELLAIVLKQHCLTIPLKTCNKSW